MSLATTEQAPIPLSRERYDAIRSELKFRPSPVIAVLSLVVHAALVSLSVVLLRSDAPLARVAAHVVLPVVFFQAFGLLHECGHGSFSTSRTFNALVGHCASLLCFLPFFPWKYVHAEHHAWTGNADRDPGLSLVRRAKRRGELPLLLRVAWRLWLPLGGLAQHVVYWSYPLVAWHSGRLSGKRLVRSLVSVALLPLGYLALHRLAPDIVSLSRLWPSLLAYLVLVELVNIPHHVGLTSVEERLPSWQQHLPTRSCNYPRGLSELLLLNFNFHIEHHLFPNLPWYRLRTARALIKPALGASYRETGVLDFHREARKHDLVRVLAP